MTNQVKDFGEIARGLARNPLGIIALFIILVYGFACLFTAFAKSLTDSERIPLVYFIVIFPVLVLVVFSWLVSQHSGKLFAPADFKDESNYVRMQLSAVASLSVASSKNPAVGGQPDVERTVQAVQQSTESRRQRQPRQRAEILWVDDRPDNNIYERKAFAAVGVEFTLSLNTADALEQLSHKKFEAIISDMGRREGPREGYALLDAVRARGDETPLFFYAASRAPEHVRETHEHGGQGCTNDANELFRMVTQAVF
jgi:CheY-like chemotaxis protein/cytochrome c oxidase subunit IV